MVDDYPVLIRSSDSGLNAACPTLVYNYLTSNEALIADVLPSNETASIE